MREIRFKNADSIGHAYIISSASTDSAYGAALQIAQAAVCKSSGQVPCCKCEACRKAAGQTHPDVLTIDRQRDDKGKVKNLVSVEQVREASSDAVILPNEAPRKVYIFREAAYMNVQAQNAALKFLEEPPNGAVVILCVINSEQLLATVRSRCTEINISEEPGENTSEDSEILLLAEGYIKAVAAGNQFALWRFCEEHNSLSIRELEAVSLAVMQILTDMLCRRRDACGLSREELLHLTKLISRCLDYLKLNVNVKQIFGLLETDSILRGT